MKDIDRLLSESLHEIGEAAERERSGRRDAARSRLVHRYRRRWIGKASWAIAGAAMAAVAGLFVVTRPDDKTEDGLPPPTGEAVIDVFTVGRHPYDIAVAPEAVWVTDTDAGLLHRLDPVTGEVVASIELRGRPEDVDLDGNLIWVSNPAQGTVALVDATTNLVVGSPVAVGPAPSTIEMAAEAGGVWVVVGERRLVRLDADAPLSTQPPRSGSTTIRMPRRVLDVGSGLGSIWVLGQGVLYAVTPQPPYALGPGFSVSSGGDADLVVGAGALWIADRSVDVLTKVSADNGEDLGRAPIGGDYVDMAVGDGVMWVLYRNADGGVMLGAFGIAEVEAVGEPVVLEGDPVQVTSAGGTLWVTDRTAPQIARVVPLPTASPG